MSSEVDKNIATKLPSVIILPAYKLAAAAEKPHCGIIPNIAPNIGPNFPDFFIACNDFSPALFYNNSINKYVINKNGNSFSESIIASNNASII